MACHFVFLGQYVVTGKKTERRGWAPISKNKKCQPGAWENAKHKNSQYPIFTTSAFKKNQ